jgi:hypothetical protein
LFHRAGQWKYAQDRLKLQWAAQKQAAKAGSKQRSATSAAAVPAPAAASMRTSVDKSADSAAGSNVVAEAAVDPVTGKLPLLRSADELHQEFWSSSKHGKTMLEQVSALQLRFVLFIEHRVCCYCKAVVHYRTDAIFKHLTQAYFNSACHLLLFPQLQQGGDALSGGAYNPRSLVMERFALGARRALALATRRQWALYLRNKSFLVFRMLQVRCEGQFECIRGSGGWRSMASFACRVLADLSPPSSTFGHRRSC